jgi:hypothetical protein
MVLVADGEQFPERVRILPTDEVEVVVGLWFNQASNNDATHRAGFLFLLKELSKFEIHD